MSTLINYVSLCLHSYDLYYYFVKTLAKRQGLTEDEHNENVSEADTPLRNHTIFH